MNSPDISRRSFLKTSLAAAAGPLILPRRFFGANAPNNTINVAMIGMGRQAFYSNTQPFLNMPEVRVVAVCDVDSWRAEQGRKLVDDYYASQKGAVSGKGCAVYRDFREVLARSDVDAVMISTPDHWHVPIAIAAAKAGKDISCEKPLTLSIAEGRILSDAVRKANRVFRTDSEFRSLTICQRACQIVRNGRIGRLLTIKTGVPKEVDSWVAPASEPVPKELDYDFWLGPAPEAPYQVKRVHPPNNLKDRPGWMRVSTYCDGMICNWGTHLNDVAQWGNATDDTGPVEVEADYGQMRLLASSNELLHYKPGPNEVHLPLRSEKLDFIDCVRTRKRTLADAETGHRSNTICHLARISNALGGRRLSWDPAAETFPGDPEANKLLTRSSFRSPWQL